MKLFVLGEFEDTKSPFEIVWPLISFCQKSRLKYNFHKKYYYKKTELTVLTYLFSKEITEKRENLGRLRSAPLSSWKSKNIRRNFMFF